MLVGRIGSMIVVVALGATTAMTGGCHTIGGVGSDMQGIGKHIEGGAKMVDGWLEETEAPVKAMPMAKAPQSPGAAY